MSSLMLLSRRSLSSSGSLEIRVFSAIGAKKGVLPMPDSRPMAGVRFCMGLSMQMYIFSASLIWLFSTMWVMVS